MKTLDGYLLLRGQLIEVEVVSGFCLPSANCIVEISHCVVCGRVVDPFREKLREHVPRAG